MVPTQPDHTFGSCDTGEVSLAEFFSRPILLTSLSWVPNASFPFTVIDPWTLLFTNKRFANRINNYNLARAKLHIKITVNGNPFYFGRLMASYKPMATSDEFVLARPYISADNVGLSQKPRIFIDPTVSQGGELVLPFVWPWNGVNLPLGDFTNLGRLVLSELAILRHANASTRDITVNVFGWVENMVLSVPTCQNTSGLTPQSGTEEVGMISTPAAAMSSVAASLTKVPYIKPYAMACEVALSAVASVAKAFGYSRPSVVADIMPMVPQYGNFANTNASENVIRMSLDQKAEVCVDSRVVGLNGDDEMSIKSIATRETWIASIPWPLNTGATALLWNVRVSPILALQPIAPNDLEFHIPAITHVSLPFKYWRGSIKYRFQVVSSGFHKGRVRIVWEPRYPTSIAAATEMNLPYTRVVDISNEKDFEIVVGWGSKYPWLRTATINDSLTFRDIDLFTTPVDDTTNGVLGIYVLNELAAPNSTSSTSDITIQVFVSAGDDFEVAVPYENHLDSLAYNPPPGVTVAPVIEPVPPEEPLLLEVQSGMEIADCCSTPFAPASSYRLGPSLDGTDDIYKVMIPDPVASIRQVLKRYNLHSVFVPDVQPGVVNIAQELRPVFPYYRGFNALGPDSSTSGPYAYAENTLLNWFTPGYVCRRGSIRWKYLHTGPNGDNASPHNFLSCGNALAATGFGRSNILVPATTTPNIVRAGYALLSPGTGGFHTQPSRMNPMMQIEFPHLNARRFYTARTLNMLTSNGDIDYHYISQYQEPSASGTLTTVLGYVAAGDDYDLSFYIGAPIVFQYSTPTPT